MQPGVALGRYKIIRQLGKGGMGEVYLASDSELDRQVAIKVLPESLRTDPERLARFRREAKAAARLNHPNIATIHSIEKDDDPNGDPIHFIVMEFVDGETLSDRVPPGGMELDAFFETFIPLADALALAHEQGRVHRDIKPGNIMVAKDGTPKILDFGLARIVPQIIETQIDSEVPTQTMKAKDPGSDPSAMNPGPKLMGTPQYMSPEQAEQEETDHRTDIFSLGVVMYEALTGRKAFEGKSRMSLLAKIINEQPAPITELRPVTPHQLWWTMRKSLEKDRVHRMQTASELSMELRHVHEEIEAGTVLVEASAVLPTPEPLPELKSIPFWRQPVALGFAVLLLTVGLSTSWILKPDNEMPLRKFHIEIERIDGSSAISPNGMMVAYTGGQTSRLWIRDLATTEPREIQDSDGAILPFWSPESDQIAYLADNELRKVTVSKGGSLTLYKPTPGTNLWQGVWLADGSIILLQGNSRELVSIPSMGGKPEIFFQADSTSPSFHFDGINRLPDDKILLTRHNEEESTSDLLVMSDDNSELLLHTAFKGDQLYTPVYDPAGFILYNQQTRGQSNIWSLPFDAGSSQVTGEPFVVAQKAALPTVSSGGTLVFNDAPDGAGGQLIWTNRSGVVAGTIGQPHEENLWQPRLSPDESQVAVSAMEHGNMDVWVYEADRLTATRLTYHDSFDGDPSWSPDGSMLVFSSLRNDDGDLFQVRSDGSGKIEPLVIASGGQRQPFWSRDGKNVLYTTTGKGAPNLWSKHLQDDLPPSVLFETEHNIYSPALSPRGRYVAYQSDETGRPEIYVRSFPDGNGKWQVSGQGGEDPRWNGDATELYYVSGDSLMAVNVSTRGVFRIGNSQALFGASTVGAFSLVNNYDVSKDGQRFVTLQQITGRKNPTITVVQNWYAEFKDKQP